MAAIQSRVNSKDAKGDEVRETAELKHYKVWFAKEKTNKEIKSISACTGEHYSFQIGAKNKYEAAEIYVSNWDSSDLEDHVALALTERNVIVMVLELKGPEEDEGKPERVKVECSWSVSYSAEAADV